VNIDFTPPFTNTIAEIVGAFEGREGTGRRLLLDAAALLEDKIRERIIADAQALGIDPGDLLTKMLTGGVAAAPAKRERAAKAKPDAPDDDLVLLTALLEAIGDGRVTAKGLAARFKGLTAVRVYSVLAAESALGEVARRVKLEPNGRTWTRVKP